MRRLRAVDLPDHVELTSVSGVDDVVVPAVSTTKRGAASVTTNPAGAGDHAAIVRDRQAMTAARLALEQRPPACVGWADGIRGAVEPVLIRRVELTVGRGAARLVDPPVLPFPGPFPLVPLNAGIVPETRKSAHAHRREPRHADPEPPARATSRSVAPVGASR
jgi:hypothetical protein